MLFADSSEDNHSENRKLAEMPSFGEENWNTKFQAYVSDHFGFRKQLVTCDSILKAELFHVSAEDDVIIGKNGWLYYTPTVKDYLGQTTVSESGLQNILSNLKMMQDYADSKGTKMLTAVVPNKNTVYPSNMPEHYKNFGTDGNLKQLQTLLSDSDIRYADLSEALIQESKSENWALPLYYPRDTHWNAAGALKGYRTMMDALECPYQKFSEASYHIEKNHKSDLQKMLFPNSESMDQDAVYDINFNFIYQGHHIDANDITINTLNTTGTGSLLMFRDSFGEAVIPYFSQNFQTVRYSRARPNPFYNLEISHFDYVILEIVERNIAWLQKEAPVHGALKADFVPESSAQGSAEVFFDRETPSFIQFYGTVQLPEQLKTAPEYLFTLTDSSGNSVSYQAYHCYEAEKLGSEEILDNGWSLYIPETDFSKDETYQMTLAVVMQDDCFSCKLGEFSLFS